MMPVVVQVAFPSDPGLLDELVWLVTLVPAYLLALHYGLRGAFVALIMGTGLLLAVQFTLAVNYTPDDPRIVVPIYIAYGALAISVGWLSEQLHEHYELALKLQAKQKSDALGNLAAGVAHDFNNILTTVVANAEIIAERLPPDDQDGQEDLEELKAAARRGAGMVRKLLSLSRKGMLALRPLDLKSVLNGLMPTLERLVPDTFQLELAASDSLPVVAADEGAVEHIVMNLVTNARDAMPHGGRIRIELRLGRLDSDHRRREGWGDPGEYVCLSVVDQGSGMDEATRQQIFEPFFSTKEPGEGIGLGMAMVYGLVKQHRGFVDVESTPGIGTTLRVYFPIAKDHVARPPASRASPPLKGSGTILIVEDEDGIRRAAQRILERCGYTVYTAADGEEALRAYREHRKKLDLVLCDVVLPKLMGPDVYQTIRREPSPPRFLFMSGYPAHSVKTQAALDPTLPFIQKPWTVEELTAAVRDAMNSTTT